MSRVRHETGSGLRPHPTLDRRTAWSGTSPPAAWWGTTPVRGSGVSWSVVITDLAVGGRRVCCGRRRRWRGRAARIRAHAGARRPQGRGRSRGRPHGLDLSQRGHRPPNPSAGVLRPHVGDRHVARRTRTSVWRQRTEQRPSPHRFQRVLLRRVFRVPGARASVGTWPASTTKDLWRASSFHAHGRWS